MIQEVKLVNTGVTYTLYYTDETGEKLIPEVTPVAFSNIQAVIAYVENVKTTEDERVEALKDEIAQREAEKVVLKEEKDRLAAYLLEIDLDEETMLELIEIFPTWGPNGILYEVGSRVKLAGKLYKVIQEHTSQADWAPDVAQSLFVEIVPPQVIPEFVQPAGAHDAYPAGVKVVFEGQVYESLIDGNSWSPLTYPQGWRLIE